MSVCDTGSVTVCEKCMHMYIYVFENLMYMYK